MSTATKQELLARYGPLGTGDRKLDIPALGQAVSLERVLTWLGVNFGDVATIDGMQIADNRWPFVSTTGMTRASMPWSLGRRDALCASCALTWPIFPMIRKSLAGSPQS